MRSWLNLYPTGRKHCSCCRCWRHGVDFNVRRWADEPHCTVPLWLQSVCRSCISEKNRVRNGYSRRAAHPFGHSNGKLYRQHRNERNRITRRKARRKRNEAEYKRMWRNAKRAEKRHNENEKGQ